MNPKVFISYSWDDKSHEDWVQAFANELRKSGVDADIDKFVTQEGTVNLNVMMVDKIKNSDFTIIVMTPNYTLRADDSKGGVGMETQLLLNYVHDNPKKIIPILKNGVGSENSIPFYLKGFEYTDFSNPMNFAESFKVILYRILNQPRYHKEPLGDIPELIAHKPVLPQENSEEIGNLGLDIPNLLPITDIDKRKFIRSAYDGIIARLLVIAKATQQANTHFEFNYEKVTSRESLIQFYLGGNHKRSVKIWIGGFGGSSNENIMLSYDALSFGNGNSSNGWISCEVEDDRMILRPMFGLRGSEGAEVNSIADSIWEEIMPYLR